jgi:hypothetical protein
VTTMWVLTEVGDALHRGRNRETFARFLDTLDGHEDFEVVPASPELFQRGVELFRARPDKEMVAHRLHLLRRNGGEGAE